MLKSLKELLARVAVGVAVGFLGAMPMASAAGFYHGDMSSGSEGSFVVTSGIILFCLTLALMGPIVRGGSSLLGALARSETRPSPAMALGLIAAGAVCVVASLGFAWSGYASNVRSAAEGMTRLMLTAKEAGINNFNFNLPSPDRSSAVGPMILTVLAFLLGSSLIGLGVWSSLGMPAVGSAFPYGNHHAPKEPIPAVDEARL